MSFEVLQQRVREAGAAMFVRPHSNQLFLVYTGMKQRLMGNPAQFFSKARLLERNIVVFQGRPRTYYRDGISDQINSFEAFLSWQRALCEQLPHVERVFCMGTSIGGYAAILYGYYLGVEAVWAFSPRTIVTEQTMSGQQGPASSDLAELLTRSNGKTEYHIYYNRRSEIDESAAVRLGGASGVSLWPQDGEGHMVVQSLIDSERLPSLFPEPS